MGFFLRKSKSKSKSKSKIKASPDVVSEVAPVTNDPSLTNIDNASSGSAPDATFSEDPSTSCSALDSWTQESMETPRVTNSTCPSRLSVVEGKELLELEEAEATPSPVTELKVDYDANPTLLYKFIEYRDWNEAWERCSVAPEDARTWVIRYEDYKDSDECSESDYETKVIRWKMLPIHVAIVFNAPVKLVTALLKAYPEAIRETDDRKMLPIHLACRNLTNLNVAQFLIIKDSGTLTMTDYKGRTVLAILKEYREKNEKKIDRDSKEELKNRDVLIKMISKKLGIVETTQERSGSCSDSEYSTDKGSDSFEESLGEDDKSTIDSFESKNGSGDSTCTDKEHFDSAEATFSASKSKSHESSIAEMTSAESQKSILKNPRAKSIAEKSIEHAMQSRNDDFNSLLGADDYNIIPKDQAGKNYIKRNKKAKKPANEADYDTQPSVLIKLIEKKMWKQAITRCVDFPAEASIWMCRLQKVKGENDVKKEVRWKILPIHSAIVLHSPVELIESLVDAYPQGLRKGDDRNMLPLHMAFRLGEFNWCERISCESFHFFGTHFQSIT